MRLRRGTLDGVKPAACHVGEGYTRGNQQIAEGFAVASPHAPTKLMELAESEILSILHDYRVYVWHVESRLDYGCSQQDVVLVSGKVEDSVFEQFGRHLTVPYHRTGIGDKAANAFLHRKELLDAIAHDENLSASGEFEVDGFANDVVVAWRHAGLYGIAVRRRRRNHA